MLIVCEGIRPYHSEVRRLKACLSTFRWGFTPNPTRVYPTLDPDQRALDQLRFVRFAVKPADHLLFSDKHARISNLMLPLPISMFPSGKENTN
jgi:hypothetical protein